MNASVELSILKLVIASSIFTKIILSSLLLISIISWAIIFHKLFYISSYRSSISSFLKTLTTQTNLSYIEESCTHFSQSIAKTMPVLILKIIKLRAQGKTIPSPDAVINNAAMHEMNKLQNGMGMLATTANISPLLGLLGTVWGIMYSFISIGQQGSASIATVAPGIAEALVTTIAGLVVAIPAQVGYNHLMGNVNHCLDYLERTAEFAKSLFLKETSS